MCTQKQNKFFYSLENCTVYHLGTQDFKSPITTNFYLGVMCSVFKKFKAQPNGWWACSAVTMQYMVSNVQQFD